MQQQLLDDLPMEPTGLTTVVPAPAPPDMLQLLVARTHAQLHDLREFLEHDLQEEEHDPFVLVSREDLFDLLQDVTKFVALA